MARYYKPISREVFLQKVQNLMETDEVWYQLPSKIEKDLSKVNFDFENVTGFDDNENFATYPIGHHELAPDFHVYFVNAGGDWEFPICFVFYWSGTELRAYIPSSGNVWNKKEKCAYGSEDECEDGYDQDELEAQINYELLVQDITSRIIRKN